MYVLASVKEYAHVHVFTQVCSLNKNIHEVIFEYK